MPTIQDIQALVAQTYCVTLCDILSRRRDQRTVRPRHIAIWLARQTTFCSLPEIGQAFGGRDHTTVLHAIRLVEARLAADPGYAGVRGLLATISNNQLGEAA